MSRSRINNLVIGFLETEGEYVYWKFNIPNIFTVERLREEIKLIIDGLIF